MWELVTHPSNLVFSISICLLFPSHDTLSTFNYFPLSPFVNVESQKLFESRYHIISYILIQELLFLPSSYHALLSPLNDASEPSKALQAILLGSLIAYLAIRLMVPKRQNLSIAYMSYGFLTYFQFTHFVTETIFTHNKEYIDRLLSSNAFNVFD